MQQNPKIYEKIYSGIAEYDSDYIKQVLFCPPLLDDDLGFPVKLSERHSKYMNVVNGLRLTTDFPDKAQHSVFFLGACMGFGYGSEDRYTIASYLQRELNQSFGGTYYGVFNYSLIDHYTLELYFEQILSRISFKPGDVFIYFPYCNYFLRHEITERYMQERAKEALSTYISPYNAFNAEIKNKDLYISQRHLSHRGNEIYAKLLCSAINLKPASRSSQKQIEAPALEPAKSLPREEVLSQFPKNNNAMNEGIKKYVRDLQKGQKPFKGRIGAVVMNCNPFTYGHRYLAKFAAKEVDFLYVFVVEEDQSYFPFSDRLMLVKKGLEDISNIRVVPSGKFIISSETFTEYFNKDEMNDAIVDVSLDVTIFAKDIAPALGISVRFVGEEPYCEVTRQYNRAIEEILPQYDVTVRKIPRITANGEVISASKVRTLYEKSEFDLLRSFVPVSTLNYLKKRKYTY